MGGLLLGVNYVHTRNLMFAIIFHFSWNFLQGPVLGFPVSGLKITGLLEATTEGHRWFTGGAFGLEGSAVQTVLFVIGITTLFLWHRDRFPDIKNPGE
jgi:hypothetical protein